MSKYALKSLLPILPAMPGISFKTIAALFSFFALSYSVPVYDAFDGILKNSGKTFTYNYGLNSVFMIAGTYILIQTETDWKWNRFAYGNKSVANAGLPLYYTGTFVPFIMPFSLYGAGYGRDNSKMQTAGIAVAQAGIITTALTTGLKMLTGRKLPGVLEHERNYEEENYSGDFAFGFWKRRALRGWPSGHTSAAWAMAAVLTEFYPNNIPLAIGLYTYAFCVGLSASVSMHWLSDIFAGALLGYAVGKTVGQHFAKKEDRSSATISPNGIMLVWNF